MTNPLDLSEVIRSVCQFLSFKDLLTCSEINKLWNFECRTWLRERNQVYVFSHPTNTSPCCKILKDFNDLLPRMRTVPFNGLQIKPEGNSGCGLRCLRHKNVDELYKNILSFFKFVLKRLSVDCSSLTEEATDMASLRCPAAKLVTKLLELRGDVLEYLEVDSMPKVATLFPVEEEGIEKLLPRICLPKLKTFQCSGADDYDECPVFLILEVLRMAPNLINLNVELGPEYLTICSRQESFKFQCVRRLYCNEPNPRDLEIYEKLASVDPKLFTLNGNFSFIFPRLEDGEQLNILENFWNHLMRIIRSSADTLEGICAEPILAVMLMLNRCPPLRKVNDLRFEIPYEPEELEAAHDLIRRVDFDSLFPSLRRLQLIADYEYNYQFTMQGYYRRFDHLRPPVQPFPNSKITGIDLEGSHVAEEVIADLVNLFPCVTKFAYRRGDAAINFPKILSSVWPTLKMLFIQGKLDPINLDAAFCGIHLEEAALLRELGSDFLELANIVPIAPAVDRLKELRRLDLWLKAKPYELLLALAVEKPAISTVSSVFMLRRLPKLRVNFWFPDWTPTEYLRQLTSLSQVTVNNSLDREDLDID